MTPEIYVKSTYIILSEPFNWGKTTVNILIPQIVKFISILRVKHYGFSNFMFEIKCTKYELKGR